MTFVSTSTSHRPSPANSTPYQRSTSSSSPKPNPNQSANSSTSGLAASTSKNTSYTSWLNDIGGAVNSINNAVTVFEHADDMKPEQAAISGAEAGAGVGALFGGIGAGVGALVGGAVGFFKSIFGHKDKNKEERKAVRAMLAQNTPLGPNLLFNGYVGNGEVGQISLHGKSHKVDNSSGVLAQATGLTNVLAAVLAPKNPRLQAEVSAMFLNAISGARDFSEALYSVQSLTEGMGLNPDILAKTMVDQYQQGAITRDQLSEHLAYIDILAGIAPGPEDGSTAETNPAEADTPEQTALTDAAGESWSGSAPITKPAQDVSWSLV